MARIEGDMAGSSIGKATARKLGTAILVALALLAVGPVAGAMAAAPNLRIISPHSGADTNISSPFIEGTTEDKGDQVSVKIYEEAAGGPVLVQALGPIAPSEGAWSVHATSLRDRSYTVVAEQLDLETLELASDNATFTVDTTAPHITLTAQPTIIGTSTPTLEGTTDDQAAVKLRVYLGTEVASGKEVAGTTTGPNGGTAWEASVGSLKDGTYTAIAEQIDGAGNPGVSNTSTFTVKTKGPEVTLNEVAPATNDTSKSTRVRPRRAVPRKAFQRR